MRNWPQLFLYFWLLPGILAAQQIVSDFGARAKGMGNANTSIADEWAIFNNVGGISGIKNGTVSFGYDHFFELEGFDQIAASIVQPFKFGTIGISFHKFGDELYSEQVASAAFGNKIGFVRLGAKASYYQLRIDEFGTAGAMFFDLGGIVEILPKFHFGAYISNFTLSKLNSVAKNALPVIMKIGFSYIPAKQVIINLDLFKDVEYSPILKAGIEYGILDKFYLRTGVNSSPFKGFFGAGLHLKSFKIDYAVNSYQYLGTSHQATVSYSYQKRDEK